MNFDKKLIITIAMLSIAACNRVDRGQHVYENFVRCSASYSKFWQSAEGMGLKHKPDAIEIGLFGGVAGSGRTLGKSEGQIAQDMDRAWKKASVSDDVPDQCFTLLGAGPKK